MKFRDDITEICLFASNSTVDFIERDDLVGPIFSILTIFTRLNVKIDMYSKFIATILL